MIRRKADQENSLTRHSFGILIPRLLDYSDVFSAARLIDYCNTHLHIGFQDKRLPKGIVKLYIPQMNEGVR